MEPPPRSRRSRRSSSKCPLSLTSALEIASQKPSATAVVYSSNHPLYKFDYLHSNPGIFDTRRVLSKRENPIPLIVTNKCGDTIWPGIATQGGEGPESSGFELGPGATMNMTVGSTWQGRVWGRTNCTVSGDAATCLTGDCFGKMDCEYGVSHIIHAATSV
jgi:hypothetical protein